MRLRKVSHGKPSGIGLKERGNKEVNVTIGLLFTLTVIAIIRLCVGVRYIFYSLISMHFFFCNLKIHTRRIDEVARICHKISKQTM